jgi:hypothetical protein
MSSGENLLETLETCLYSKQDDEKHFSGFASADPSCQKELIQGRIRTAGMVRLAALFALLSTASASAGRQQHAVKNAANNSPSKIIQALSARNSERKGGPAYRGMSTTSHVSSLSGDKKRLGKEIAKGQRAQLHRAMSKLGQGSRGVNWKKIKAGLVVPLSMSSSLCVCIQIHVAFQPIPGDMHLH